MTRTLPLLVLVRSDELNIGHRRHINPIVRRNALSTVAEMRIETAIRPVIDLLARETDDAVRSAAVDTLERLTGAKANGPDFIKWQKWWEDEGKKRFSSAK